MRFLPLYLLLVTASLSATSVPASTYGFDPDDATEALRSAILSDFDTVVIDRQATDWVIGSLHFSGVDDKTLIFEPGVVVRAKAGAFADPDACLFRFFNSDNLALIGYGAELRMNRAEYAERNDSEYRHALSLWSCRNVRVSGLTLAESGGDGIYIGGETSAGIDAPCRNIRIDNVDCVRNYRQGMSVANVVGLHVRNSRFRQTAGTLPEAGVDLEPYQNDQLLQDVSFTECSFTGNGWAGIAVALEYMDGSNPDVDIRFTGCYLSENRRSGNTYGFAELFVAANGDSPVGGNVVFERLLIDGSDWTAFYGRTAAGSFTTTLRDCVLRDVSRLQIDFNNPIWLEKAPQSSQLTNANGPYVFENLTLSYRTDFPPLRSFDLDTVRDLTLDWQRFCPQDRDNDWGPTEFGEGVALTDRYATSAAASAVAVSADTLTASECDGLPVTITTTTEARAYSRPLLRAWGGAATPRNDYDYLPPGSVLPPQATTHSDTVYARADAVAETRESVQFGLRPSSFLTGGTNDGLTFFLADCPTIEPQAGDLYPFGPVFARWLYSLEEDYTGAATSGWNAGHTYAAAPTPPDFFATNAAAGLHALAHLSATDSLGERWPRDPAVTRAEIEEQAANDNLAWWNLPEELRYWVDNELEIVRNYTAATRAHDPKRRPNYMYLPGHYLAENIEPYVPFLDILPASCYVNSEQTPHAYVRWSIERTRAAIAQAGYTEGPDYRKGEKSVFAILELFDDGRPLSAQGSWHDYWLAVALDVRGVGVFSHFNRHDNPSNAAAWASLDGANRLFTREKIDDYLLDGTTVNLTPSVTEGPELGPEFLVDGDGPFQYSSLKTLGKRLGDTLFVALVNSADTAVSYALALDRSGPFAAQRLVSGAGTQVQGALTGEVEALGVHLYKLFRSDSFFVARHDEAEDIIYVDEVPFLPIGFYAEGLPFSDYPGIPALLADAGFNFIFTESTVEEPQPYDRFLRQCDSLGLKNIVGTPYAFVGGEEEFGLYVTRYADYPSVIAWNILDDANAFDEPTIALQRELLNDYDRSRLTSGSWYATGPLERMLPYVELAAMQGYPWENDGNDLAASHVVYRAMTDTARLVGTYSLGTPQAYNWPGETYPPAAHLDVQSYQALATGNRGLLFYTLKDYDVTSTIDVTQPEIFATASKVAGEVLNSELHDVVLFGDFEATWINFYRNYGHWDYGDAHYYVVVNTSATETFAYDIALPTDAGDAAENLFPDRPDSLRVENGRLVGQLAPYQPAIYRVAKRTNATESPGEPTAAGVYPNPSPGRFRFSDVGLSGACTVYDAAGKPVRELRLLAGRPVDLGGLPAGTYAVRVKAGDGRIVTARVRVSR